MKTTFLVSHHCPIGSDWIQRTNGDINDIQTLMELFLVELFYYLEFVRTFSRIATRCSPETIGQLHVQHPKSPLNWNQTGDSWHPSGTHMLCFAVCTSRHDWIYTTLQDRHWLIAFWLNGRLRFDFIIWLPACNQIKILLYYYYVIIKLSMNLSTKYCNSTKKTQDWKQIWS